MDAFPPMSRPLQRILVVDDDEAIRLITEKALSRIGGFSVAVAASGVEGVDMALAEAPDMILLDAMMPGLDGPATLGRLRAHAATAALPVVFFTAKAMPAEIERLRNLGVAAVLTKPFDPRELCERLLAIWNGLADG
jgi:CheY-like chemotaxis protein